MNIFAGLPGRTAGLALVLGLSCAEPCFAVSGELVDKVATGLAVFIIIAMPIAGIVLFWLVHILPEKMAEKRHHPQKDAIQVLCLLSLFFGGLLWPLAWLWAYTKPVLHKAAYGRDKHDDYYDALEAEAEDEPVLSGRGDLERLRHDLDELEKRAGVSAESRGIRARLAELEAASRDMRGGRL